MKRRWKVSSTGQRLEQEADKTEVGTDASERVQGRGLLI
jgi:hypothetical protein